jgi:hypothetical protein
VTLLGPASRDRYLELIRSVVADDPMAKAVVWDLFAGDDLDGDHPVIGSDGVLALLETLGVTGGALARLYVQTGRDAEVVRVLVWAVTEGHLPIHRLRDAADGLPVDLEIERIRAEAGAASAS